MQNKAKKTNKVTEYLYSERFKPTKLSKYFWAFSLTIILAGLILLCAVGFNLGMDFTGGNVISVKTGAAVADSAAFNNVSTRIEKVLADNGLAVSQIQKAGTGAEMEVQVQYQNINGDMTAINAKVQNDLTTEFAAEGYSVTPSQTKSASASGELLLNSFLALAIAILVILIYIAIRFELVSGLAAIITLFHDVIVMCAFVLIFRIEVNAAFIAALITILGYSVNNTIVVFDRIRENLKLDSLSNLSNSEIANLSIRQTLARTMGTSITTIAAVVMLAVLGVSSIQQFIIPIIIGLIVGTYAAIFISAPLWAKIITNSRFDKRSPNYVPRKNKKDNEKKISATESAKVDQNEAPVVEAEAKPVAD